MGYYRNPTESAAIGAVDKELRQMERWAARIKQRRRNGQQISAQELTSAKRAFVGIYRRLLREALEG